MSIARMPELVLLIKKHGPVPVLESFALICEENAKTISETGKRSRNPVWREQSFGSSSKWWGLARRTREVAGEFWERESEPGPGWPGK